jgi:hypothetical protein
MRTLISALIFTALSLSVAPALAQTAKRLEQFRDWATYSYSGDNGPVCYILSVPSAKEPAHLNHGDIFFSVSQKPGQNAAYEPQFISGYDLRENSKVTVTIDGRKFSMFTRGNLAWLDDPAEEPAMVAAMRAGSRMQVTAVSGRGNNTSYTFSLSGVTAALDSIRSCS